MTRPSSASRGTAQAPYGLAERFDEFHDALPAGENASSQRDIDRAMAHLRTADERVSTPKGIAPQTMDGITASVKQSV
ncbi:MAG: hypothetical protein F2801_08070, partial [Actinobacteria bacterium]|nr:hypothetical protein [Actinomycetota bacterium]